MSAPKHLLRGARADAVFTGDPRPVGGRINLISSVTKRLGERAFVAFRPATPIIPFTSPRAQDEAMQRL